MKDRSNQVLEAQECLEIIHKKLNENSMQEFCLIKHEIVPIQQTNGYLGQYFYLKVSVARPESPTDRRHMRFFIKIRPPKGTKQYDVVCNSGMFNREIGLYTRLFPEICCEKSDNDYLPTCYLGLENDVLVLEDMTLKGFRIIPEKLDSLDISHCKIVMNTLGKYHARSIIFEERNKMSLLDFCREKKIAIRSYDGPPPSVFTIGVQCALSVIDCITEMESSTRDKLKALVNKIQAEMHKMLVPSAKYRNVQLHGDLWTNNLLFKYDDIDEKPVRCCFIDFQNTRYAPPAYDLLVFLFYTTTKAMRAEHCDTLYRSYYSSFEECLLLENIDIKEVFPWNAFMESINEFKIFGLLRAIVALPIILSDMQTIGHKTSQLWSSVSNETLSFYSNQFKTNKRFKNRMLDIFSELECFL